MTTFSMGRRALIAAVAAIGLAGPVSAGGHQVLDSIHFLIPGGAADTNLLPVNPGDEGRTGADGMLVSPDVMRAPIKWLASTQSDGWNGKRFIGRLWDGSLPADEAAKACSAPAGFGDRA